MKEPIMDLMGVPQAAPAAPATAAKGVGFNPSQEIDWDGLTSMFQLSPEEVQTLQIPRPEEGMSLGQRLQRLRPRANIGDLEIQLEDNGISGRMAF